MFERDPFSWAAAYTWVHVFAIALLQLAVFRRYDFALMYAFHLFYYAYRYIAWGVFRLDVLFYDPAGIRTDRSRGPGN